MGHTSFDTEKRLPHARWETFDIVFASADTDMVIPHTLNPTQAGDVMFEVMDASVGGVVYRGTKVPQLDFIVLRATVIGTYRVRLFLESHV